MNIEAIVWLAIMVFFVVVEIATMGLYTIWFAGGCLIAFLAALLGFGVMTQIIMGIVVSAVLIIFTRPIAKEKLNKDMIRTNVESLVGQNAVIIEAVDNEKNTGRAIVNGQEWMARAVEGQGRLETDVKVEIAEISGVKLILKRVED